MVDKKYPYWDMPFEGREIRKYTWVFTNRPTFYLDRDNSWQIPEHYLTDGYSIPWFARWMAHKGQNNKLGSGGHDYLCEYCKSGRLKLTHKFVNRLFKVMMEAPIWYKEDQEFRQNIPDDFKKMAWAVKHFGPRW